MNSEQRRGQASGVPAWSPTLKKSLLTPALVGTCPKPKWSLRTQPIGRSGDKSAVVVDVAESVPVWRQVEPPKKVSTDRLPATFPWRANLNSADPLEIVKHGVNTEKVCCENATAAAVGCPPVTCVRGLLSCSDHMQPSVDVEPAAEPTPGQANISSDIFDTSTNGEFGNGKEKLSEGEVGCSRRGSVVPPWKRTRARLGIAVDEGSITLEPSGPSMVKSAFPWRRTDTASVVLSTEASSEPEAEFAIPLVMAEAHASSQTCDGQGEEVRCGDVSDGLVRISVYHLADLLRWRHVADDSLPSGVELGNALAVTKDLTGIHLKCPTAPKKTTASGETVLRPKKSELHVSVSSWAAQQRQQRTNAIDACVDKGEEPKADTDKEVGRTIKSILNKLTVEKFGPLSEKLMHVQFSTPDHVAILVEEVFEKSTLQHHFIDMYADLCELLHGFFSDRFPFKRLLLNECQASFERHLKPPVDLDKLDDDDRIAEETKYKMRMLGNIRFVGALASRRMLATKVILTILQELLGETTEATLESVAALLTVIGPTLDTKDGNFHQVFDSVFARVKEVSRQSTCRPRLRCLLQNVLELRANGWQSARPKRLEAPTTLQAVAQTCSASSWDTHKRKSERGALPSHGTSNKSR
eukprot:TRINITY_DN6779_c0_g2_i1.p1 TRINITY_DN6779_c0_g2~~TRINITY_DN6779_c0_g2_i1.p1  ORF type:complete len:640 (-),score=95.48 TRINITY_DN6779_c0_g2_i1:14-1933(-)